jgi:hypothetical protein
MYYLIKPNNATDPFELFLAKVGGHDTQAWVEIFERGSQPCNETINDIPKREDFGEKASLTMTKKWDGCSELEISDHWCNTPPAKTIAFWIETAGYLCDQMMADESYMFDTHEEALQHLNCGDGADENPGVTVIEHPYKDPQVEVKPEGQGGRIEIPLPSVNIWQLLMDTQNDAFFKDNK